MKILFVSSWFPHPQDNGSRIRIYNLLKGLGARHQVVLLSFVDRLDTAQDISALNGFCSQVELVLRKEINPKSNLALLGFFNSAPRSMVDTYSPQMANAISRHMSNDYDVVIASQLSMLPYCNLFQSKPALLEEVELAAIFDPPCKTKAIEVRFRHYLTWLKTRNYVARRLPYFNACTVVSERERNILNQVMHSNQQIELIPNCVDYIRYQRVRANPQPNNLIFTGSLTYAANYDAVRFFLDDIYPLIQKQIPQVKFRVTGRQDGVQLSPLRTDASVELLGYVTSVLAYLASSWISVVPLRYGGGTRLKILEAMALGTAVVSTSKGAEGLEVEHGKHLLIADEPGDFATCVIQLLQNRDLRQQLSLNGKRLVEEKYDWRVVMPSFLEIVDRVVARANR